MGERVEEWMGELENGICGEVEKWIAVQWFTGSMVHWISRPTSYFLLLTSDFWFNGSLVVW
jgi:hypothetical protein